MNLLNKWTASNTWCNISINMNCCQEVKHRMAMAKEAFNRKSNIFCEPLEKVLRKRLVKCFVWSVALYVQRLGYYDGMSKNDGKMLRRGYEGGWSVLNGQTKNGVVLERVGEGRITLEPIKKRKRNWMGHWLRRNCLLKDTLEGMVNGKKVRGRRRYQMIDNIMINGLYEEGRLRRG